MNNGYQKYKAMRHQLKTLKKYFQEVKDGKKKFELRKNDRDFKVNDELELMEYENDQYTGQRVLCKVRYILKDCPQYGLRNGYCIMGIDVF